MLKKRLVFTLLYDSGFFMLSRNFRLQRVGDIEWLQKNYDFSHIAFFIDELVILDVSRSGRNLDRFCETLKAISSGCFVPIAAGGGIRSIQDARKLFSAGADKIVVNTALFDDPDLITAMSQEYGQQSIVASVDLKMSSDKKKFQAFTSCGENLIDLEASEAINKICAQPVGEIYLNSIDRDGTGQGYDFSTLNELPSSCSIPVVLAGGVGNATHMIAGFDEPRVDAVATANLFNFVGDGLKRLRNQLLATGRPLAYWPMQDDIMHERKY